MKKTMRKHLSLLLAMLMLMSCFAVSSSAACSHTISSGDPAYYLVIPATCTEMGYTIYHCTLCGQQDVQRGNYTDPLGHKYDINKPVYEYDEANDCYYKYYECERKQADKTVCGHRQYELGGEEKQVYYQVEFYNHKVTQSYDASISYTKLADTFKTSFLYSAYVKAGEAAVFGAAEPYHEKTRAYGQYNFLGWAETAQEPLFLEDHTDEERAAVIEKIGRALDAVDENKVFYPVFEGVTKSLTTANGKISHDVDIYIYNENNFLVKGTNTQTIPHGEAPAYGVNGMFYPDPVKTGNIVEDYAFIGWKLGSASSDTAGLLSTQQMTNKNSNPIYDDIAIYPCFEPVARNYTVEFYNYDKNGDLQLLKYYPMGAGVEFTAVFDGVHLKQNTLVREDMNVFNNVADEYVKRERTAEYIYEWTGKWALEGTNRVIDLTSIELGMADFSNVYDADGNQVMVNADGEDDPNGTEPKKVIKLVPVYNQRKRLYNVNVRMYVPASEDIDYYLGEAVVQIIDKNGQLAASGKTNADGEFSCQLSYNIPFTVSVATADDKYLGEKTIAYLDPDNTTVVGVPVELNPDYGRACGCICHNSFIRPIWVRILNILYNLFNLKYVCCYDMYSNLGSMLDYTE